MSRRVQCDEHGEDTAAFVCTHILDTLRDREPRGFLWLRDDGGEYSAICQDCNESTDEEWEEMSSDVIRLVCLGCFKKAASLNDVSIDWGLQ